MKRAVQYFFSLTFQLIAYTAWSQNQVSLEHLIYRAIIEEGKEIGREYSEETELLLDNYYEYELSPEVLVKKYPDLKPLMVNDSILVLKSNLFLNGWIDDDKAGIQFDTRVLFKNLHFQNVRLNWELRSLSVSNEIFRGSRFEFDNCEFNLLALEKANMNLRWNDSKIAEFRSFYPSVDPDILVLENSELQEIYIRELVAGRLIFDGNVIGHTNIADVNINRFDFAENTVDLGFFEKQGVNYNIPEEADSTYGRSDILRASSFSFLGEIFYLEFIGNEFKSSDGYHRYFISPGLTRLTFKENQFEGHLHMAPVVTDAAKIYHNEFNAIDIFDMSLPITAQHPLLLEWNQFSGKLNIREGRSPIYKAENKLELADTIRFQRFINQYHKMYKALKGSGNSEAADRALIEMKEYLGRRYNYVYEQEGGLDNFFKIRLHQLMANYTRHGTNPAQALTASVYIILFFSFIYFFFPSEWDTSSKQKMYKQLRVLWFEKQKRSFRSIGKLILAFFQSVVNAITLSVNSFVTLGFGRIPASGAAKYICIFQGFLGWFLLSIYIVALINQIMV